jgi:hypothetical protein
VLLLPVGWLGARSRVRVDRRGVLYSAFRTTFVPASEIDSLQVRAVAGLGPVDRAQVAVVRKHGSEVRLNPTDVVRSGPDHSTVLAQIEAMQRALGDSNGIALGPSTGRRNT